MAQVVVITGGSAGIGRAAAERFARAGWSVGLIARGAERLEAARAALAATGVAVAVAEADVADAAALEAAAARLEAALGPIDVWVNNAMATIYAPIAEATTEELARVTAVTYLGSVHGTKAALQRMEERGGTIVQVSSVLSWRAIPLQGAYCGAKFALRGFTESLRSELLATRSRVRLSMVHLPAVNTPQFDWARARAGRRPKAPDGVYQPEVAADAILFAATSAPRDVFVGASTPGTIVAARLAPGLVDRFLARKGFDAQLEPGHAEPQEGNLFAPVPGTQGAHGRFDAQARARRDIYSSRQADALATGVLALGALGVVALLGAPAMLLRRR